MKISAYTIRDVLLATRNAQLRRDPETMEFVRKAKEEPRDPERIGFALEMAEQYGAVVIDDDAEVYAIRAEALADMMSVLGFRTRHERERKQVRMRTECVWPRKGDA